MSFILDALRKAENRNRDNHEMSVPTGPRVLIDETPDPPPNWRNIIVVGIFGLALLGAGLLFGLRENPAKAPLFDDTAAGNFTNPDSVSKSPGMTMPGRAPDTGANTPVRAASNDASPTVPTNYGTRTRDTGARALDKEAAKSQGPRSVEPTTRATTATPPVVSTAPVTAPVRVRNESLPDYLSIVQSGQVALPQLHLDMHVYSATPEKRLVFVNLNKLRAGDKVDANTTIESIEPDGVIIDHKGLRFILRPD